MNVTAPHVQTILICILLLVLCAFLLTITVILINYHSTYTNIFTHLDIIQRRISLCKIELLELDAESSAMKSRVEDTFKSWGKDTARHTRIQHASIRIGEREAARLRYAVEGSCVRIERLFKEFGWVLVGEDGPGNSADERNRRPGSTEMVYTIGSLVP